MKQKLLTLLTLLLLVCSGAWGQTTLFNVSVIATEDKTVAQSVSGTLIPSTNITTENGDMYVINKNSSSKTYIKSSIGPSGDKRKCFRIDTNDIVFKIELDNALQAGDEISTAFHNNNVELWITTSSDRPGSAPSTKLTKGTDTSSIWHTSSTYTVKVGDGICGQQVIFLHRNSNTTHFTDFTITRPAPATPTLTGAFSPASVEVTQGDDAPSLPTYTVTASDASSTAGKYDVAYSLKDGSTPGIITFDENDGISAISTSTVGEATLIATISNPASGYAIGTATAEYTVTVNAPVAPAITSITSDPNPATVEQNETVTFTAVVTGKPTPTVNWYECNSTGGDRSASKGTGLTYSPATDEVGVKYYIAVASNGVEPNAESAVQTVTVTVAKKDITLSFSETEVSYYHYDGETFVAPTLSAVDGESNPVDVAELDIVYSSDRLSDQFTKFTTINSSTGAVTMNESTVGIDVVTASFAGNAEYNAATPVTYQINKLPLVRQAILSNTFDAFIDEGTNKVTAYYIAGTSAPTLTAGNVTLAPGHTASVDGTTLTVTNTTTNDVKTYSIVTNPVTPFEGVGQQTFDGTETYVASAYGWDPSSSKKWKFSKTDSNWTREAPGKTRLYFFVGAGTSAAFSFSTSRAINIKVNGVSAGTNAGSITLNADQPNMIEIKSNQTSGDGGFKDMTIIGPKKAITIGSHGYSTLISDKILNFDGVDGLTAYRATRDDKTVTLNTVTEVPANKGIVLQGTASETYYVPLLTSTEAVVETDLTGNATAEYDLVSGKHYYVLAYANDAEGFYHYTGSAAIPAGKAFFETDDELTTGGGANYLSIIFGDEENNEQGETTSINAIENALIMNGDAYNLAGQKVGADYKGIVIVNGKKYLRK